MIRLLKTSHQILFLILILQTVAHCEVQWSESGLPELKSAALRGDASAQFELGNRFFNGDDVPKSNYEAAGWFQKSAAQGNPGGQCWLAVSYENGLGVKLDYDKAAFWYYKAAIQDGEDSIFAQNQLAGCYYFGRGFPKDPEKAVKWYSKAAEAGFALAQTNLGNCYDNGEGVVENPAESHK